MGLGTNWVTIAGSETNNILQTPLSPAAPAVFCRLKYP